MNVNSNNIADISFYDLINWDSMTHTVRVDESKYSFCRDSASFYKRKLSFFSHSEF